MRKLLILSMAISLLAACQQNDASKGSAVPAGQAYASFGETITADDATSVASLAAMGNDSVYTKVKGTIVDVCQAKGCWMKVDLGNNQTMRVTFKDYGFFVPKDSKGKEVVIEGVAMRKITPVEELQHYAKDAGKTVDEVAAIVEPAQEVAFEAVGVLIHGGS